MRGLRGTSLLEAIVAALVFLIVFAATMELMPRFAIREDDAVLVAEANYRVGNVFRKYATGEWPCGEYEETCEWGCIRVVIVPYRDFSDIRSLSVSASIYGSRKSITFTQLIECRE